MKFKAEMVPAMSAVASDGSSYVAADGSNQVASTWDVPDLEAFQAAQCSFAPELAEMAKRAGMTPSTVVVYVKKSSIRVGVRCMARPARGGPLALSSGVGSVLGLTSTWSYRSGPAPLPVAPVSTIVHQPPRG